MKSIHLNLAVLAFLAVADAAFAQPALNAPLPRSVGQRAIAGAHPAAQAASAPTAAAPAFAASAAVTFERLPVKSPTPRGPAGAVDKVLERIQANMAPHADDLDAQSEQNINRALSLSRSTSMSLRPVGFMKVGEDRFIFASEDGNRMVRLKEHSRLGAIQIAKITEDGVEYMVGGKRMYAPIAYVKTDGPSTQKTSPSMGSAEASGSQQPVSR